MLCALNLVAFLEDGRVGIDVVIDDVLDLVGIELQPGAHVLGDVFRVERALLNIAEDRFRAVVAGDDDIAAVVSCVEDVVVGISLFCVLGGTLAWGLEGLPDVVEDFALGEQIGLCRVERSLFAYRLCHCQKREAGADDRKDNLFHV